MGFRGQSYMEMEFRLTRWIGYLPKFPIHPGLCRHNSIAYFFGQMELRFKRIPAREKKNITAHLGNEELFMFAPRPCRQRGHSAHMMSSFSMATGSHICLTIRLLDIFLPCSSAHLFHVYCPCVLNHPVSFSKTAPLWLGDHLCSTGTGSQSPLY